MFNINKNQCFFPINLKFKGVWRFRVECLSFFLSSARARMLPRFNWPPCLFDSSYLVQQLTAHLAFCIFKVIILAFELCSSLYFISLLGNLSGKVFNLLFLRSSNYFFINLYSDSSIIFFILSSFSSDRLNWAFFCSAFLRMLRISAQDSTFGGIDSTF